MKSATKFCRPELTSLENRALPGSLLNTALESSLLTGGLVPFDFQDHDSQVQAQVSSSWVNSPAENAVPRVPAENGNAMGQSPDPLGLRPAALGNLFVDPAQTAALYPLQLAPFQTLKTDPLGSMSDHLQNASSVHRNGPSNGADICEDPGNIVVNGGFETIPPPDVWFSIDDPFASIVEGGGHLTPEHHLVFGAIGVPGIVYQDLTTQIDQVYTIRFSIHLGPIGPPNTVFLQVMWNDDVLVADLSTMPPSDNYTREEFVAAVTGHGTDRFQFIEQQDNDFWHVDDVCVTPSV